MKDESMTFFFSYFVTDSYIHQTYSRSCCNLYGVHWASFGTECVPDVDKVSDHFLEQVWMEVLLLDEKNDMVIRFCEKLV